MGVNGFETSDILTLATVSDRRYFTLAQANATLPLVKRVVRDIVDQYQQVLKLCVNLRGYAADGVTESTIQDLEVQRQSATMRLNDLVSELSEIGCELKDWECGLVDYPSLVEGQEVFLCWKLDEEEVGHWHDEHAGDLGRLKIDDSTTFETLVE